MTKIKYFYFIFACSRKKGVKDDTRKKTLLLASGGRVGTAITQCPQLYKFRSETRFRAQSRGLHPRLLWLRPKRSRLAPLPDLPAGFATVLLARF